MGRWKQQIVRVLVLWACGWSSAAVAGGAKSATGASALPPVGERTYVLDEASRYAPVRIEGQGEAVRRLSRPGRFLKDPMQPGSGYQPPKPVAKPVPRPAPPKPVAKARPGQLRFKAMPVRGHVKQPRVAFSRDMLPLDRADEPITQDFYEKVFEPARDDDF